MTAYGKVEANADRHEWRPVPLPEQVILVTTVDVEEKPHVATKTRFSVLSYGPPTIIVLGCRARYHTAANIKSKGQLVINVPGDDLVATSWIIGMEQSKHGPSLFEEHGLTPIPALEVSPPRIAECRAHIECEVTNIVDLGEEIAAFAKVVAVSMNADIVEDGDVADRYLRLSPFFFLEAGHTAPLGHSRSVEEPVFGPGHEVTILATSDLKASTRFYSAAFGWPIRTKNNTYVEFELPGGRALALCDRDGFAKEVGKLSIAADDSLVSDVQIYLHCEDLPRTIASLHTAGARPLSKLKIRAWGDEVAYFASPDGHVIAVARRSK